MICARRFLRCVLPILIVCPMPLGANELAPRRDVITNSPESDGFGSQFQTIIAAAVCAELQGKIFLYTPFTSMKNNFENDPDYLVKKEKLINFIGNFDLNPYSDLPIKNYKGAFDKNVAACAKSKMLSKIKTIFRANKNRDSYFDARYCNIAIHIRRVNAHNDRLAGSDTPDEFFSAAIGTLRKKFEAQNPQFHLYSQGNPTDYEKFRADDVVLHINESIEDTFTAMVFADVLVSVASSLSYAAGLLSDGIVYYIPFWHAPLPDWISSNTLVPSSLAQEYR